MCPKTTAITSVAWSGILRCGKGLAPRRSCPPDVSAWAPPEQCIEVIENYERIGADEIMPIFQAGPATDEEVKNSPRLFGKYVIPHFKEKEKRAQAAGASTADN